MNCVANASLGDQHFAKTTRTSFMAFDSTLGIWTHHPPLPVCGRDFAAVAVDNNRLVAVGGSDLDENKTCRS